MVADPLPVDKRRKLAINLGFIPVLLSIGAAALAIFEFNSAWRPALTIIPAAAAYGVLRRTSIISYSRGIRKALLARRRAASSNTAQMNAEEQAALNASVKQPSKPWIANSALDKFLLPVMALLATAVPFAGTIHLPHKGTDSGPAAPVAVSAADHVPRPPAPIRIAVQPLPVPAPEAPASAVPTEIPVSSEQAAVANSTTMESPVQSTSEPAEPAAPPVPPAAPLAQVATPPLAGVILQMLQFARANDWSAVDAMAVTSAASAGNLPGADLNTARTQNDAGTAAFHRNDMQAAVAAFRLAAAANPSDPQILDNLAFALIRSGRSEEAVPLLNQILNRSPARATAWGNLSVAVLPDAAASTAALKLAFHFNQNRQRITSYFTPLATSYPDERYRTVVRSVLANADTIPIRPPSRQ
jgi:tetratricopeptide (TPR) repeat protein